MEPLRRYQFFIIKLPAFSPILCCIIFGCENVGHLQGILYTGGWKFLTFNEVALCGIKADLRKPK